MAVDDFTQLPTEALLELIEQKRTTHHAQSALTTLLVADYLHTLPSEVRYIWPAPWSAVKILFLLTRYLAFINLFAGLSYGHSETRTLTAETCHVLLRMECMSVLATVLFAEAILFIRVYALSGRSKLLVRYLIPHFLIVHTTEFILMGYVMMNSLHPINPAVSEHIGCLAIPASPRTVELLSGVYSLFVFSGVVLLSIMIWLCYQNFGHVDMSASNLIAVFVRDGCAYFLVIASQAIANIVISLTVGQGYNIILGE
ncbi:hypothetical protein FA15DRAFT_313858 [Coprinopsis marcescibilis]|uniref:DUF6533 domain-containing protein n=1 Tax=Coprinopsis marcescibilis TaxID=230819 RepID=A0A5C3KC52_COPMA|nr:hypothetical protein FA15DRAFT_313858 [Coprinopsis marcescibilis]